MKRFSYTLMILCLLALTACQSEKDAKQPVAVTESADVPPVWCNCSAAFVKKPYEVIFGQPLKAEILETVLTGGRWCRFVIHLPAGIA